MVVIEAESKWNLLNVEINVCEFVLVMIIMRVMEMVEMMIEGKIFIALIA
jgi:hypothetical protein